MPGKPSATQTRINFERFSRYGFVGLFAAYVVMAVLVIDYPVIGYTGLLFILGTWCAYSIVNRKMPFVIPRANVWLALALTAAIGLSSLSWNTGSDLKDVVGLYAFYIFIPSLYVAINYTFGEIKSYVNDAFNVLFIGTFALVLIDLLVNGFSLYRSYVLGLNKNTVAFFFEVLYAYILFDSRKKSSTWTATVIFIGCITLLIIFSKTSFGLGLIFTFGYFSSTLFFLSGTLVAIVVGALMFTGNPENLQVLKTVVYRYLLWQDAIQEITYSVQHFLLGYGPGNFTSEIHKFGLFKKQAIHNYFLQIVHGFGAITLAVIASYFFWIFRRFGVLTSGPVAAFWIFNLHATFDVGWVTGQGFLASLILGMILAQNLPGSSLASRSAPTAGSLDTGTGET